MAEYMIGKVDEFPSGKAVAGTGRQTSVPSSNNLT